MGQGEPGHCYPQIRRAIVLTDRALARIGQKVHRYIISSSGVPEMLDLLIEDLRQKTFANRVTVHFSLHAVGNQRTDLMPVNKLYPYDRFLSKAKTLTDVTGEKTAIGILLFEGFVPAKRAKAPFTITQTYLDEIMDQLHPQYHRLDLCDVNLNHAIAQQYEMSNEKARELLAHARQRGFEAKLFSSFGTDKSSGCGMLTSSRANIQPVDTTTVRHFAQTVDLLRAVLKDGV